jgi:hypothetical protein
MHDKPRWISIFTSRKAVDHSRPVPSRFGGYRRYFHGNARRCSGARPWMRKRREYGNDIHSRAHACVDITCSGQYYYTIVGISSSPHSKLHTHTVLDAAASSVHSPTMTSRASGCCRSCSGSKLLLTLYHNIIL